MPAQHVQHSNFSVNQITQDRMLSYSESPVTAHQHASFCYSSQMTACSLQFTGFAAPGWCPFQAIPLSESNSSASVHMYQSHMVPHLLRSTLASLQRMTHGLTRHVPVLDPDTQFYLLVLLAIAAANSVFTFVRAFSFAYGGLAAAQKLHEQLLAAIVHAPASFFHTTPAGEVIMLPRCSLFTPRLNTTKSPCTVLYTWLPSGVLSWSYCCSVTAQLHHVTRVYSIHP